MPRYTVENVWPPFKGKTAKVVDTTTGRGVSLTRTRTGAERIAKQKNAAHAADLSASTDAELEQLQALGSHDANRELAARRARAAAEQASRDRFIADHGAQGEGWE